MRKVIARMEALSVEECRRFLEVAEKSEWFPLLALTLTTGCVPANISFTLERYSHAFSSIQDKAAVKVEQLLVA